MAKQEVFQVGDVLMFPPSTAHYLLTMDGNRPKDQYALVCLTSPGYGWGGQMELTGVEDGVRVRFVGLLDSNIAEEVEDGYRPQFVKKFKFQ